MPLNTQIAVGPARKAGAVAVHVAFTVVFGVGMLILLLTLVVVGVFAVMLLLVSFGLAGGLFLGFGAEYPRGPFWLMGPWLLATAALGHYYFFKGQYRGFWFTTAIFGLLYIGLALRLLNLTPNLDR